MDNNEEPALTKLNRKEAKTRKSVKICSTIHFNDESRDLFFIVHCPRII